MKVYESTVHTLYFKEKNSRLNRYLNPSLHLRWLVFLPTAPPRYIESIRLSSKHEPESNVDKSIRLSKQWCIPGRKAGDSDKNTGSRIFLKKKECTLFRIKQPET